MSTPVNRFISDAAAWATSNQALPRRSLPRVSGALRRAISALKARDDMFELHARDLGEQRLRSALSGTGQWLLASGQHLWVVAEAPDWGKGWSRFDKDEHVAQLVSHFFHSAGQYVARSRMANIVGAIALTYRVPLEFRYADKMSMARRVRNGRLTREAVAQSFHLEQKAESRVSSRDRLASQWGSLLNCLQPHLHRMVYQYLRALKLEENGHLEESVTALDGVVTVALQFAREALGWTFGREETLQRFVGPADSQLLGRLYALRCAFGAHPSCGKWWDFGELYEDELNEFPDVISRLIRSVAMLERTHRSVEVAPTSWAEWFQTNCHLLWRAVWFDHVP
mgnify:CR=1 FL=1